MSTIHNFVVFNKVTGMIVSSGTTQLPELLETDINGVLIDTTADIENDYVDGISVKSKGTSPSLNHIFDYVSKTWIDPRSLQDLKDTKWNLIKSLRDTEIYSILNTPYGVFDADDKATNKIVQTVTLLSNSPVYTTVEFTLNDNTTVIMDKDKMIEVGLTLANREQTLRNKATLLRNAIYVANSTEQLDNINW